MPRLRSAYNGLKLQTQGYATVCSLDLTEVYLADGAPWGKPQNGHR